MMFNQNYFLYFAFKNEYNCARNIKLFISRRIIVASILLTTRETYRIMKKRKGNQLKSHLEIFCIEQYLKLNI